ncbi:efflux RND transporter permease subunit [Paludibacterium paludis]|uniref:Resistance-nodulation-cell division (RND) efflux transporter n=1 Tax=Paludibacterium paludis TaxID=1225769 RepID=A0A918NZC1_9NEIS|nr:efflux RND transporter permease subunit [Paludibacterium paludis]GGY08668.1 resistance-nodulation-cell division (RND) efflux transporter [Paludibacterium paludis]
MKKLNLSEWSLKHQALVVYLMVMLMAGGVFAYLKLGQKEDPDFTFKAMLVRVNWPGATTLEMERQVTDPVEKKLQEMSEIDSVRSYTKPGETVMVIALRENVPPKKVEGLWYQLRKKLGDMSHTLPAGVQGPFFNDEFGETYGNMFAFTGDGFSSEELRREVDRVREEVLRLPDVARADLVGEQEPRVYVDVSTARLAGLGLDSRLIWNSLASQNAVTPAGTFETGTDRIRVRPSGAFNSLDAIRATPIAANGNTFRLSDIARIDRGVVDPAESTMRYNGKPALGLAISMVNGGDVMRLGRDLDALMATLKKNLPVGIEVHAISDQPKVVEHSISEFMHSLAEAVVIVLAVSFFSLGWRPGVVVALSIPLVLAMTFLAMYLFGIDLQRISLGSLIIALGLLVDDAIIAVEMMQLKLEQGWTRFKAATFAYTSTAFPMLTGTLITAATFLPVGIAKSDAGEYVFSLFAVVGIALILSWVVAVVFTPYLGYRLLPEHQVAHADHDVYAKPFYIRFRSVLEWCLDHRKTVIALTLIAFIVSLGAFRLFVQQQFFPSSNRPELMVDLWLPQGASHDATERETRRLEAKLAGNKHIVSITSYVGNGSPRYYLPLDQQQQHMNYAQLMVMTRDEHVREDVKKTIETLFETDFPMVRGRVTRLENGPPVGYPVQFRVSGPDHATVRGIATRVENMMRATPGLKHVDNNWGEEVKALHVDIDQDKARALGIGNQDLSRQLQMLISGAPVTQYREGDRNIQVVVRLDHGERQDVAGLGNLMIQTGTGRYVPLSQIGKIRYAPEEGIVWRHNHLPTITVRGDPVDGVQGSDISIRLWPKIQELEKTLPVGYHIELGGSLESSEKSQTAIAAVQPLMLVIVLTLLMLQLQSFQRTLMVVLTAPLGMIGVTLSLILFSAPFGFVAMLGVIALAGMIMRNSVILVDQIEHDIRDGIAPWEAILGSTVRRFRPIMLTALAAILAMIPLTRSTFWGPMAVAIMGGLLVATVLTLLFLPALYAQWFKVSRPRNNI